jgi:hypothetical protein
MRHLMTFHRWSFMSRRAAVAVLVVLVVVAVLAGYGAACASATGRPPGTIRSGTSLSDSRIARDAELRASDFPGSGWFSTPGPSSLGHSPCAGVNGAQAALSAGAISPQFTSKIANTAESTTYVYADSQAATHWFGQLTSRSTRACVVRTISQSVVASTRGEGVTVGPVRAHRLATPPIGDQRAGIRLSVRVSSGGIGLDADADLIFVQVGRGIVVFDFGGVGSPFGRGLESKLMGTAARRLARDLARGS